MSLYSNVTEQNMITLRKLAEQQKNQHAPELVTPKVMHEEYILPGYPIDDSYFDNVFLETNVAKGITFKVDKQVLVIILLWSLIMAIKF